MGGGGWLPLLWLWKQGTVYSLVLGGVGSCACWPAEADPHTVPGWAHVVCALYIPEVQFANVLTMEPIVLQYVPHDRFNKVSGPSPVPFLAYCPGLPPLCSLGEPRRWMLTAGLPSMHRQVYACAL